MSLVTLPVFTIYLYKEYFNLESENVTNAIKLKVVNMTNSKDITLDIRKIPLFRNVSEMNALNCTVINAQNLQDKIPMLKHLICMNLNGEGLISHPELQSLYVFNEQAKKLQLNMPSLRNLSANIKSISSVTKQIHNLILHTTNIDQFSDHANIRYLSFSTYIDDDTLIKVVDTFPDLIRLCLLKANISRTQLKKLSNSSIRTLYLHRSVLIEDELIIDSGVNMFDLIPVNWLKEIMGYNVFIFDGNDCLDLTRINSS